MESIIDNWNITTALIQLMKTEAMSLEDSMEKAYENVWREESKDENYIIIL